MSYTSLMRYHDKYVDKLERVAKISAQIYRVTSLASLTKQVSCPHGIRPEFPTHAWWCDDCWNELKEALDDLTDEDES